MRRNGIFELSLTVAPFSNRLGESWVNDKEMNKMFDRSHLYMVAHRPEPLLVSCIPKDGMELDLGIRFHGQDIHYVTLPMLQFGDPDMVEIRHSESFNAIIIKDGLTGETLQWLTPDRMDYLYRHGVLELNDYQRPKNIDVFDLLYVGISKKSDSFTRLFRRAHEKRCRILGIEEPLSFRSISHELVMLLFEISETRITSLVPSEDINDQAMQDLLGENTIPLPGLAEEAERVFVRLLEAKYNEVLFKNYPAVQTAAFTRENFDHAMFFINEDITLKTDNGILRGASNQELGLFSPTVDVVTVRQDSIEIFPKG